MLLVMATGTTAETRCPGCGLRNRLPVASRGRPRCARCHRDLAWSVAAGDQDFDAATDTSLLVLVDLWAAWCGPCRAMAPVVERLGADYAGRLKIVKVDVDASPAVAARFGAQSIPTFVLLRDGAPVDRIVGAQSEQAMRRHVEAALAA
jgi:thioredoxin 2